ncbi:MAG: hypothetical protein UX09_C0062G0002 [Candidatus Uhrbacteria bacterium GW2011_GWE2_45_35]|uniref:Pre-toxin TG domain-containing protein n=2 Tax=Candidatus Uhriibacteriota TaxID=1752732 RepID=A0A0G1JAZ6_9BACT|nr:MAG: hypothetical protein UW63_C0075G0002 [Candidatus Uhrbacteria bacterium GW2011_GWF2_44_350]KKU05994.1 MAG: hypothetical protein UX09_C0062G0002 [Candidatus Uhrbacteria bacterium GW2011_GWE2_45_35]HBR80436.1 hypothetical protein [Candidatus Uhrbacteria bacterium]HCU31441.1 hypothetical protein [Candidatus Uhrbacteria bacterium]
MARERSSNSGERRDKKKKKKKPETPEETAAREAREQTTAEQKERKRVREVAETARKIIETRARTEDLAAVMDQAREPEEKEVKLGRGRNGETLVLVKVGTGFQDLLQTIGEREVKLIPGSRLDTDPESGKVSVPENLRPRDLPFLVREILRAGHRGRQVEVMVGDNKTKWEKTGAGLALEKEAKARKEYQAGLAQIRKDWGTQEFWEVRKKYIKLEDKLSETFLAAEKTLEPLMSEAARKFEVATGRGLYDGIGGEMAYRRAWKERILARQDRMVNQYDKNGNGRFLGQPAIGVRELPIHTGWDLVPVVGSFRHLLRGPHGDLPSLVREKRNYWDGSQTVQDARLRALVRRVDAFGEDNSVTERALKASLVDAPATFGKTALLFTGGLAITALELGLKPVNWLGNAVGDTTEDLFSWVLKKTAPWIKKFKTSKEAREEDAKWLKSKTDQYLKK